MKITVKGMVLSGLAIFAIAMLHNPRQLSANLPTTSWHASKMLADGGIPMPPWNSSGNAMLADGGIPMPPWPSSSNLAAISDGGPVNGSRDLQATTHSA
jgi:hypothetical protein